MQTALTGLVLAGILWLADTANENARTIGIVSVRLEALTARVLDLKEEMREGMTDRFTATDAKRHADRMGRLEREFRDHLAKGHSQ